MKKIILILILILLIFFNPVTALYQNNPTYVESINCLYDFDGESIGCTKTTSGSVSIEYQSPYGYVMRIGDGYTDNADGKVTINLNTLYNGDFEVVILYNTLGVKGYSEGRTDTIGVEMGDYRFYLKWSNYDSNLYNGQVVLYKISSRSVLKSVTGDVNLWSTYFSKDKFYKIIIGKKSDKYYVRIVDITSDTVLKEFTLSENKIKAPLDKVFIHTFQGRALIDNIIIYGTAYERPIKQPYIIEFKDGDFQYLMYPEFSHTITVFNFNSYDLRNYQVKIIIHEWDVEGKFYWIKRGSIRLYDSSGNELPYYVEEWDSENRKAVIWTKVPYIPAEDSIQLTLKSSLKFNDKSNPELVFDFYDDFSTDSITSGKWQIVKNYGTIQIINGQLQSIQDSGTANGLVVADIGKELSNWVFEVYAKFNLAGYGRGIYFVNDVNSVSDGVLIHGDSDDYPSTIKIENGKHAWMYNFDISQHEIWHKYEFRAISGKSIEVIIDDNFVTSASFNPTAPQRYILVGNNDVVGSDGDWTDIYIDWLRVRKYSEEEAIAFFGTSPPEYTYTLLLFNPNEYDLNDYQVKLKITEEIVGEKFWWEREGSIRIYDSSGNELPYWVEEWDAENRKAIVWTKVSIPARNSVKVTLKSSIYFNDISNPRAVFDFYEDFEEETLDGWQFSGDKPWTVTSSTAYEGKYSVMNMDIRDSQSSYMYTTVNVPEKAVISFYWKVSSEGCCDKLRFYVNGEELANIGGYVSWQKEEYLLNPGQVEIKFGYTKDGSITYGEDAGYVDQIMIRKHAYKEPEIVILKESVPEYTHKLLVFNPNNYDLVDYQVKIVITGDDVGEQFYWDREGSIRLYDSNGVELPYYVEEWDTNTKRAVVWVKVPYIPARGSTELTLKSYLYYGDISNGKLVFEFFDDFEGGFLEGWQFSGNKPWALTNSVVYEGKYSVMNMDIRDSQSSYMYTTVNVPEPNSGNTQVKALISFYWKVSSEGCCDKLRFYVNGEELANIGGYVDWSYEEIRILETGQVEIKFGYTKDGSITYGEDAGYVDQIKIRKFADEEPEVVFVKDSMPEYIHTMTFLNPNNYDLVDYQLKLTITEENVGNQFYWERKGSVRFYDSNGNELYYWVENWDTENKIAIIWVKIPYFPANSVITITMKSNLYYGDLSNSKLVFDFFEDFEDGDLFGWQFSGNKPWTVTTSSCEGRYSAMNMDIRDSQSSYMYTTVNVPEKAVISFYWKVSSEGCCDKLRFYVNGVEVDNISGYIDWQKEEYVLEPGEYEIKFGYTKDGSVSYGYDAGFVDFIIIRRYADEEPTVTFVS